MESPDGGYVCFYTGFDGKIGTLMVATSDDLRRWTKHGPAFRDTPYAWRSSKSGAVVTEVREGRLVASRFDDRFWMYWGEGTCFAATSTDLLHWAPVEYDATADRYLTYDGGAWQVHRVPGPAARARCCSRAAPASTPCSSSRDRRPCAHPPACC